MLIFLFLFCIHEGAGRCNSDAVPVMGIKHHCTYSYPGLFKIHKSVSIQCSLNNTWVITPILILV